MSKPTKTEQKKSIRTAYLHKRNTMDAEKRWEASEKIA